MERLDATAAGALRGALATQPLTDAKVAFAWAISAGPTLARATRVSYTEGVLSIWTKSLPWSQEINRGRRVLLLRLEGLLGPGVVRDLRVLSEEASRA